MAAVYSTRFFRQSQGGPASYTVPVGKVAVLRSVTVVNRGASFAAAKCVLVGSPNIFITSDELPAATSSSAWSSLVHDLRFVFLAGEQIAAVSDTSIDMTACGYLFSSS